MWKKLEEYRKKYKMFSESDVVIAGVSGGADSMCLLCVLDIWRTQIGFELVVVHVNHGLRGEQADIEETYVRQVCETRKIPFEVFRYDIKAAASEQRLSEEEMGRILRRQAFEETAKKYGGTKIALAHHKNDNAETFLFNLARGSRLKGLGGIRPVNGSYVRPLLALTRKEIEEWLNKEQIHYYIDKTNESDLYTRNRIRRHVIPYLEEHVNSQSVSHIDQAAMYLQEVQEYLEEQMAILWKEMVVVNEQGVFVKDELATTPALMRSMVLQKALVTAAGKEKNLTEVHVEILEKLLGQQNGRGWNLPYYLHAEKTYGGLMIYVKKEEKESLPEVVFSGNDETFVCGPYEVQIRVMERNEETLLPPKKRFTKWFDYDIITKSVCIRGKKPGDRIVISENGNSQKVKQYFVNEKVPRKLRDTIPIIAEGDQVLWIVGYRQSKAYQITENTRRILEININGGD